MSEDVSKNMSKNMGKNMSKDMRKDKNKDMSKNISNKNISNNKSYNINIRNSNVVMQDYIITSGAIKTVFILSKNTNISVGESNSKIKIIIKYK